MGKGQELLDAARKGDTKIVEKILAQITKRSGPFTSLRRGAGVNVQDDNGYTPLHHACLRGHEDIVRLLLSVDASPCVVDKKGATPLHLAAWKGDELIVNMLLSHSTPSVNVDQLTSDQESALLIAAQFGNKEVVAQLLSRGADVTVQNKREETALDLAAQYGRLEVVQHLLHANPHLVDRYRFPTCRGQQFPHTPLHRASKNGHKEVVMTLIAAGVDPNVKTANGTALHEAAYYGKASVVRVLLARGADLSAADRRGKTVRDVMAEFSGEATRRVQKAIIEHVAKTSYDSEEDVPGFPTLGTRPLRSPSDYYDYETTPETPNFTNLINDTSSCTSSSMNKTHSRSFVQKLASRCLSLKAKFSSAPNISNSPGKESEVDVNKKSKENKNRYSSNAVLIGNSKFLKRLSKNDNSGDINCNNEFDTISLDRELTLERVADVNRSNRSCPGFKISLPNISENIELGEGDEQVISNGNKSDIIEGNTFNSSGFEAVNITVVANATTDPKTISIISRLSNISTASSVNECYESIENIIERNQNIFDPTPLPRHTTENPKTSTANVSQEHNVIPIPAVRTNLPNIVLGGKELIPANYENFAPISAEIPKPEPPKRKVLPIQKNFTVNNHVAIDCSPNLSRTSTLSSDSMGDEAIFEDILLSKKSKSFKHKQAQRSASVARSCDIKRSLSISSCSSDDTDVSALEDVDCSENMSIYTSMAGTLPNKTMKNVSNKKSLFRNKTFSIIEVDKPSLNKIASRFNDDFLIETLAHYHIRGTGHCIYETPTVEEFIYIFNKKSLANDSVEPFTKVPKRDSYYETAICFCKPTPPKLYNSAQNLLEISDNDGTNNVQIDTLKLMNNMEMNSTTFTCFCDDDSCKLHTNKRGSIKDLVVKFSVIKKSMSTPDITLSSPIYEIIEYKNVTKLPDVQELPISKKDVIIQHKHIQENSNDDSDLLSEINSAPSTLSTSSSRLYSIKDVAEVLSLNDEPSTSSNDYNLTFGASTNPIAYSYSKRQSSFSEISRLSLKSCQSDCTTINSNSSFKSCIEELDSDDETNSSENASDTESIKSEVSTSKRPWVRSDSFRFDNEDNIIDADMIVNEENEIDSSSSEENSLRDDVRELDCNASLCVASLECGSRALVRSGSGRRRWDEAEGTSEGDALSISSAASSSVPHHLAHHQDYNKVSPTPPKKPPRRNLSVSPTHANSPSSGYSYELRAHARSQDDLDDIQGTKLYLKHGRSVDHCVDGKLSYSEYDELPRVAPVPNPRLSLKPRTQPVAITAMYENVVIKEQNPRRKLRKITQPYENYEPHKMNEVHPRKYSAQKSSLESLLDDQSMNSPSDYERCFDGGRLQIPVSPTHYDQPPTPEHPPPSARQAERSIHERIRPLSQEYKRRSIVRDSFTETEVCLLRAPSAASVASGATDRSGNTDCVEEYVCEVPFAGLFKGSTTTLDGIGLRPMPAERPKTLRKLKSVYDSSPSEQHPPLHSNGTTQERSNGMDDEIRKRSNTSSSTHSGDKSLSILSPFDEQEEWAKISEIMASFGSKLVRESVFVSELEQEFTSRLGLSCSESSLSPSVVSNLGLWLAGIGLQDYEQLFLDGGYDDIEFINGILDENDLREMGVDEADRLKILDAAKQLPHKIADISKNYNNNNHIIRLKSQNETETVAEWLKSIDLEQYSETFRKHLYVDMDRVSRIWELELTAVLEIQKAGHRKRILASVSGQQNGPVNVIQEFNTDRNTLKSNIQQLKGDIKDKLPENLKAVPPPTVPSLAPPGGETLKRSKKNRPAPQPPRPSDLEIRAPSELMVGVPGGLKTQWKHQPLVLVTGAVTYVANYLGSTVVKELRGTESTKKSIQKLKKSTKEPRDSPDIILSISYRGVKFLNTITRELVCEHEIRNIHCACQDADDLTHFAYITKDHTTKSHYCHVFCVATMDQATEVILTLGEAFEVAYQMALKEQSNRSRIQPNPPTQAKTPTHDPMTTTTKEKPNVIHGRSHSITEIKLNGHQLKIAPMPVSLSNEDFQLTARSSDGSKSPRTPLLKAPMASTEEL